MSDPASSHPWLRGPTSRLLDVRNPHFWLTQALVLLTIAAIYFTDGTTEVGATLPSSLRIAAVALTMIPVLYAALIFGMESAILTALWVVALAAPILVMGKPRDLAGVAEPAILVAVLTIGTVLASTPSAARDSARKRSRPASPCCTR